MAGCLLCLLPAPRGMVLTLGGRFASSMAGDERQDVGTRADFSFGGEWSIVRVGRAAEDAEIVLAVGAARDGDRAAFGRLYERYARMVHGILLGGGRGGGGGVLGGAG